MRDRLHDRGALRRRLRALGLGALLFAAGFTAIWSASILLSSEPKPVALAAVALAVGVGVFTGVRRLGSRRVAASSVREEYPA